MLESIIQGKFQPDPGETGLQSATSDKGTNLFSEIPAQRSCKEANVPENHCLCMVPASGPPLTPNQPIYDRLIKSVRQWIIDRLSVHFKPQCKPLIDSSWHVANVTRWTTNQMIQHGVRYPTQEYLKRLEKFLPGELEFLEVSYTIGSHFEALARWQHHKKTGTLTQTVAPLLVARRSTCNRWIDSTNFCACLAHLTA